jgi:hypothetical protein
MARTRSKNSKNSTVNLGFEAKLMGGLRRSSVSLNNDDEA